MLAAADEELVFVFGGACHSEPEPGQAYGDMVHDLCDTALLHLPSLTWLPHASLPSLPAQRGGTNALVCDGSGRSFIFGGMHSDEGSSDPTFLNAMTEVVGLEEGARPCHAIAAAAARDDENDEKEEDEEEEAAGEKPYTILRGLLSEDDVRSVLTYASQLHMGDEGEGWLRYSASHEVVYLGGGDAPPWWMHDGVWRTFQQACRPLCDKMIHEVLKARASSASGTTPQPELGIRCIELHTYTAGGGLTDPGHSDRGSVLTLSALLTASAQGGVFSTTDAQGTREEHAMARGDAIAFASECVHNVSEVEVGVRRSLVIELWAKKANRRDRFS